MMSTEEDANYVPKKKLQKRSNSCIESFFNSSLNQPDVKRTFRSCFLSKKNVSVENAFSLTCEPFPCVVLPNFISDTEFLDLLQEELLNLNFHEKSNDLYKFFQSDELKNVDSPVISGLRKLLYEDFKLWLNEVTGFEFSDVVDMTCSRYSYTDVLLCHDDELEGRRIAFILYLVPSSWSEEDGGSLDLFGVDENGQPEDVVKKILPVRNNFVFFEVSPVSFHQVSEVINRDKCRLSISGWFHGSTISRLPPFDEIQPIRKQAGCVTEELLRDWISPSYLKEDIQIQIQNKFQKDSEIELRDFLQENKYNLLCDELQKSSIKWEMKGPANKRRYEVAEADTMPPVLSDCLSVLQSEAMFLVLSNMTGLKLHPLAASNSDSDDDEENCDVADEKKCKPTCSSQVRQWSHGCYTLIHDQQSEGSEFVLDALLFCNCCDWKTEYGGWTSYIAKGEDEELLTIVPTANSLALVYKDQDTIKFVKHINHQIFEQHSQSQRFQDLCMVFCE